MAKWSNKEPQSESLAAVHESVLNGNFEFVSGLPTGESSTELNLDSSGVVMGLLACECTQVLGALAHRRRCFGRLFNEKVLARVGSKV